MHCASICSAEYRARTRFTSHVISNWAIGRGVSLALQQPVALHLCIDLVAVAALQAAVNLLSGGVYVVVVARGLVVKLASTCSTVQV